MNELSLDIEAGTFTLPPRPEVDRRPAEMMSAEAKGINKDWIGRKARRRAFQGLN